MPLSLIRGMRLHLTLPSLTAEATVKVASHEHRCHCCPTLIIRHELYAAVDRGNYTAHICEGCIRDGGRVQ